VWRSLEEASGSIEVPGWHRAELDARLAAHERGQEAKPWRQAKADVLNALRK